MTMERLIYIVVLCYFASSVLITQSSAAIGAACDANSVACGGANEECESNICVCKTGFINNAGTCEAFDCSNGGCKNGGTCGTKTCSCVTGWKGDDCGRATLGIDCSGNKPCTDANNEVCDADNNKCSCKPGFGDHSGTCKDIDECTGKTDGCHTNAACGNTVGSFTCTCNSGFVGDGKACTAFNCKDGSGTCKNGGTCPATGPTCSCVAGWTGDDCGRDIDECTAGTDGCNANAACDNTVGSFTCTCNSGFVGNGKSCTAFNCISGSDTCKNGGTCPATGTKCSCVAGWIGDDCGRDIDECATKPCKNGGTCNNGVNAFTCTCAAGWTGATCETATVGVCIGTPLACPDTVDNGVCSGTACVCKEGYKKEERENNCVFVPDNAADKTEIAAVTLMMTILTNIIMRLC